jgi:hypothetical protein
MRAETHLPKKVRSKSADWYDVRIIISLDLSTLFLVHSFCTSSTFYTLGRFACLIR